MTCPSCGSIWLRAASKYKPVEPTSDMTWSIILICGGCGKMYHALLDCMGTDKTDMERHRALREPTIAVVTSTGNAGGHS